MKLEWARVAGQQHAADGVFILRAAIAPDTLLPGLSLANGFVTVDRSMATNLPWVFAAGDVTGAPLQVAKAVGEGADRGPFRGRSPFPPPAFNQLGGTILCSQRLFSQSTAKAERPAACGALSF